MKMNIRISIIALFIGFFILIGGLIISINYLILNNVLFRVTQHSLSYIAQRIVLQVQNYLHPIDERVNISKALISQKIIELDSSEKFRNYLLKIIADNPALYGAYWGDSQGNLYLVERKSAKEFLSETILRSTNPPEMLETILNEQGDVIKPVRQLPVTFDPRIRPWYILAEKTKTNSWSRYSFKTFLNEKPMMGVTLSAPIYFSAGKLEGVFGMDMTLTSLSEYLLNLQISKNAIIFICNDKGQLITSPHSQTMTSSVTVSNTLSSIETLTAPWAVQSYRIHRQSQKGLFAYHFKNNRYLAAYIRVPIAMQENWYIAIVVPISDIMHYLQEWTYISVFISIVTLLVGAWLIYIVSRRIARSP
jgi:hypothetical protein